MTPLVSDKYKYILFYNPKSACSVMRKLFLQLHFDELNTDRQKQLQALADNNQDTWHKISSYFNCNHEQNYHDYYKFTVARHPFTRLISCYLNQIVTLNSQLEEIQQYIETHSKQKPVLSFRQVLDYISNTPLSEIKDVHLLPQTCLIGSPQVFTLKSRLPLLLDKLRSRPYEQQTLKLNAVCKIENLTEEVLRTYRKVFKKHPEKMAQVEQFFADMPLYNVTLKSNEAFENAADLSLAELQNMSSFPAYEYFFDNNISDKVRQIYQQDFDLFNYETNLSPSVSSFEKHKNELIQNSIPDDFDWQIYLQLNPDLIANGIDSAARAISHWYHFGINENRSYKH